MKAQNETPESIAQWLAPIWQDVLHLNSIGPDEDFFKLGGDPAAANRLFATIAQRSHRHLSSLAIYQARTISTLAALLRDPRPVRLQTAVQLRSGSEIAPIFLAPGLGGTVMEFFNLVKHIQSDRAIYGLQSRGLDGVDPPYETIEALAISYAHAIREVQPQGPYTLIGYSLGGLVCLEVAHEFLQQGEEISQFIMIETYPHRTYLPYPLRVPVIARLVNRRFHRQLAQAFPWIRLSTDASGRDELEGPGVDQEFVPIRQHLVEAAYRAWQHYQPRQYSGRVHFVRATEIDAPYPHNPRAAWRNWIADLIIETAPGSHLGMLGKEYQTLAAVLSRHLKSQPATVEEFVESSPEDAVTKSVSGLREPQISAKH